MGMEIITTFQRISYNPTHHPCLAKTLSDLRILFIPRGEGRERDCNTL